MEYAFTQNDQNFPQNDAVWRSGPAHFPWKQNIIQHYYLASALATYWSFTFDIEFELYTKSRYISDHMTSCLSAQSFDIHN